MNRRLFEAFSVVALVVLASCKGDPLADHGGTLQRVDLQFNYLEVVIGDSTRSFAVERDALNTPLPPTATLRSCDPSIVTVSQVSDAPQQRTGFYVKALTFGSTCVIAQADGVSDTMQVSTFPATIVVVTGPDTVESGSQASYTFIYLDRNGNPVTGVPAPTFSTSDSTVGKRVSFGTIKARSPGVVTVTFTGTGAPSGGISGTKQVIVKPAPFPGGVSPTAASPGDTVTLANVVGGPAFDADTRVTVNDARTFVFAVTPASMKFVVPGIGVTGPVKVVLTNMGAEQLAQSFNLTSSTASFADKYDATNDDPSTAPSISANGDYFIVLSGVCKDGGATAPGDDCDDFFKVTNSTGAPLAVTSRLDWFTAGSDLDMIWCKVASCSGTGNLILTGATGANPENATATIPAGATWYLWINNFDPAGNKSSIARVRVGGLP